MTDTGTEIEVAPLPGGVEHSEPNWKPDSMLTPNAHFSAAACCGWLRACATAAGARSDDIPAAGLSWLLSAAVRLARGAGVSEAGNGACEVLRCPLLVLMWTCNAQEGPRLQPVTGMQVSPPWFIVTFVGEASGGCHPGVPTKAPRKLR